MPRSETLEPVILNVTLTSADTEYSQALPIGTKYFSIQCRTAFAIRYAFATGRVATPTAPYATVKSGNWYNSPEKFGAAPWDSVAAAVAEVNTITVANTWAQNDTCTITIHGVTLVVTVGTLVTTAQVATTIQEAWEGATLTDGSASVAPTGGGPVLRDHGNLTATVSGSVVTLTADRAGERFNTNSAMTVTESTAGDGTATLANSTPAAGPAPMLYLASSEAGVVAEIIAHRAQV
jgi:hypothetical protein